MKQVWMVASVLTFLFSGVASATSMDCSDASTDVRLKTGRYEGGPRPHPQQRLYWSDLTYRGETSEDVLYSFTEKKMISASRSTLYVTEVFTALLQSKTKDGKNVSAYVICDSSEYIGPPRP